MPHRMKLYLLLIGININDMAIERIIVMNIRFVACSVKNFREILIKRGCMKYIPVEQFARSLFLDLILIFMKSKNNAGQIRRVDIQLSRLFGSGE